MAVVVMEKSGTERVRRELHVVALPLVKALLFPFQLAVY